MEGELLNPPDLLSEEELKNYVRGGRMGGEIYYYENVDSTNTAAMLLAEEGAPHGTLVCAGAQSAGKGRRGRGWQSPPGASLYMTLLLRPRFGADIAPMMTLLMALSVASSVRELTGLKTGIKWPNDVIVNRRKICGILTEMSMEGERIRHVVIGTGVNLRDQRFSEDIAQTATSLEAELGEGRKNLLPGRAKTAASCLKYFEKYYNLFEESGNLSAVREEYNSLLVNNHAGVRVLSHGGEYDGTSRGINEKGELLVEKENGEVERIYAGEVSVRGICGYV